MIHNLNICLLVVLGDPCEKFVHPPHTHTQRVYNPRVESYWAGGPAVTLRCSTPSVICPLALSTLSFQIFSAPNTSTCDLVW